MWDTIAEVTVLVSNTGNVTAAEVAQLYIGVPGRPQKQLRGFDKAVIHPGESKEIRFGLTRRDLSVWTAAGWHLQQEAYKIYVGKSVLDIQLVGDLSLN